MYWLFYLSGNTKQHLKWLVTDHYSEPSTCTHVRMCTHTHIHTNTHTHKHTQTHLQTHTQIHTHKHTHTNTNKHTHRAYTYITLHTRTYVHTYFHYNFCLGLYMWANSLFSQWNFFLQVVPPVQVVNELL